MEVLILALVGGGGLLYMSYAGPNYDTTMPPDGTVKDENGLSKSNMFDFSETGFNYQTFRPLSLQSTNLNDAYSPYASPATAPTHSIPAVMSALASNSATVETHAPNWYFKHWLEIPYTRAQQATHNIEIPGPASFKGGETLVNYPRVWMEPGYATDKQFTNKKLVRVQGMPTEFETKAVYASNKLSRDHNPYGAGGVFQRIAGSRYARNTAKLATNLSSLPDTGNFGL